MIDFLEAESAAEAGLAVATRTARSGPARTSAAESAKGAEPAHLVALLSLLGVADDVVGLGDFLEALRCLGVARVFVREVLRGELTVLLLDVVLRSGRGDIDSLIAAFVRTARSRDLDTGCVSSMRASEFTTTRDFR